MASSVPVSSSPVSTSPSPSPNTQTETNNNISTNNAAKINTTNTQGETNGNYGKRNASYKKNWDAKRNDPNGNVDLSASGEQQAQQSFNGTQRRERYDRGERSDRSNRTDNNSYYNTTPQNGEQRPEKRYYEARGRNDDYKVRRPSGDRQDRNYADKPDRRKDNNYQPNNSTNNTVSTTNNSTNNANGNINNNNNNATPNVNATQVPQHHQQVDNAKVEQSKRISSLITTPPPEVTPEQRAQVNKIKEIVGANFNDADIYHTLQEVRWNHEKAINSLLADDQNHRWSDVVRKKKEIKPETKPQEVREPREQREQRDPRSERAERKPRRERPNNQVPNGEVPPQQNLSQHNPSHQQQTQGQQSPTQTPTAPQAPEPHGEELIMGLSKAIEEQLKEIAEKTRLLLQMQNELNSIHNAGQDRLSTLQEEQRTLTSEKDRLQTQLKAVEERLVFVDDAIAQAEKEKIFKLRDWQRKSATHGLITSGTAT